ncbi:hypothetical protein WR25_05402 [Diploscapter pachys]|uniref:Uncharacterized protein n=1 Tax=Diploscapter pachys TaxID=2018661 RepID=A0A2A2KA43_9BILA|nr:hypothetical protein WR25_05402 [Diploscapter pachys]
MQVTELVARELGIFEYEQTRPQASVNGVTTVELESRGVWYRMHLVRDANNEAVTMEEGARLGAFYNSKFFLELLDTEKLEIPCEKLIRSFQIEDQHANHSIFVTNFYFVRAVKENHENIMEQQQTLLHPLIEELSDYHEQIAFDSHFLCHGKLTGENCKFEDEALIEITDWEQIHFTDPAYDLSFLIITSSDPSIRHNIHKIFRALS